MVQGNTMFVLLIAVLIMWEAFWTYKACWLAAKQNQKAWFVVFLLFNLLGIPEIIYLLYNKKRLKRSVE
tara:strand:- start:314 stop:520 length:207 start_codon:yes stop_codon:yes gene_type:complete